ncbi:tRNA (5-methylaminomethyl-2-thiouridine)(34)-methyltransferase MnmD [Halotia branconii]|uniref:MnmC family methyltransferase n=1 Tax=Halotia branconii CENA392 TaxID=1539056 RepID=A0AAJ6NTM6_9CYAN|nr:MnmC family methyltransferase [Halotia branconii]WGV26274.1 MnmC family methyltransferase [Halotia branconii CENA392]
MSDLNNFQPQLTADGSFTFVSQEFGELFHSHFGAKQESFLKFVAPTQLATSAHKPVLRLLDICYGLGYNTAAALQTIWTVNPSCNVELIGLELNPSVPQAAIAHHLFDNWNYDHTAILTQLAFEQQVQTDRLKAKLLIGDARTSIKLVHQLGFQADAIFLDPFSPPQCPQLWTVEFIKQVSLCLDIDGIMATYSCAAAVRVALLAAELQIGSTPPLGRRTPGTVAKKDKGSISYSLLFSALSLEEEEHLRTRAAIPYRDPQLLDTADAIIMRRRQEQQACSLEPTSRWRKRWLLNQGEY